MQIYPWHTLTSPVGTTAKKHAEVLANLQRLAKINDDHGANGQLILPDGWFFDPDKNKSLIDQLLQIASLDEEDPDDSA